MFGQSGHGVEGLKSFGGIGIISICITLFAPWRMAVPTQSEPVSPPPITMTLLSFAVILSLSGTDTPEFTRFCCWRSSSAKCTPFSSRPSTGRSLGCSAPIQRHTASKSLSRASAVTSTPAFMPVLNSTPSSCISFMRRSITFLLSLKSGMPKRRSPPGFSFFSNTVTVCPAWFRQSAAARPEGPLPITATFLPLLTFGMRGWI